MTFIHPLLLSGLVLVGVPVLLHLIMRQKPRHLMFPAMRFLLHRHRTNQRKLQLRHLLLLLLRMLVIASLCLALARPRIFSERLNLSSERPVAAVLVFDSSYSMQYTSGRRTCLEEAKRRSLELLNDLPVNSKVAILDTAEPGGEWVQQLSLARQKIEELQLRPANAPVTTQLATAYELLAKLEQEPTEDPEEMPLRFLYVFSDRTEACWDSRTHEHLKRLRDRVPEPGVHAVFVDVGVETPADVAIATLELPKQVISANERMVIRATVRAVATRCDTEISCQIDEDPPDQHALKLEPGESRVLTFERRNLTQGPHQAKVSLATEDALPFDNVRYATFEVRGPRQVLVISDDPADAWIFSTALRTGGAFTCDVRSTGDTRQMGRDDLAKYQAICLLNVTKPSADLWSKLELYVRDHGGVAIIPGGGADLASYNAALKAFLGDKEHTQSLLPAQLVGVVTAEAEPQSEPRAIWSEESFQHPVMAPFKEWRMAENVDFFKPGQEPGTSRYWEVKPQAVNASVVVDYAEKKVKRAALVERVFDRKFVHGRVLLFTSPLDDQHVAPRDNPRKRWNDYLKNSFYFVLVNKTMGYLAGDAEEGTFNFLSGQNVTVVLPAKPRFPTYTILGPGLTGAEAIVPRAESQSELQIAQAVMPGNYTLVDPTGKRTSCFSVNIPPEECQLNHVAKEAIEALFGEGALLPLDHKASLRDALQKRWNQPVELLPWLMMALLVLLAVENMLANKFYKREPAEDREQARGQEERPA